MKKKTVVIIGGGFAGLKLIETLARSDQYKVILVDTNNYNFFPPLIYQVSAGFMEPSAISYPFRKIIRNQKNVRFWLGSLERVIPSQNKVILSNGELEYDILVMATGVTTNYFGNKNVEDNCLPMKTISDALSLRNVILTRLDRATRVTDKAERKKLLTFVIAGAGPTGVELSGIFAEMKQHVMLRDYPELTADDLGEIYLVDGQPTVLAPMSEKSQTYTSRKLTALGVNVALNTLVKDFKDDIVYLSNGEQIVTRNLIWAAGITGMRFDGFDPDSYGRGNRLITDRFNLVQGQENIYALGDCAIISGDEDYPSGHPQMAQPAIQQARNLGQNLNRADGSWRAFKYRDKGALAIIGRNKAVLDLPGQKRSTGGFVAWLIWFFVHIMSLVNFRNKMRAVYDWAGYYINKDQSFRMIIKPSPRKNRPE